jgi:uncharacterized protein YkwD
MAAVVALTLLALAPSASAQTQTFSGGSPVSFGALEATPYPSTLDVSGMGGTITDVNVVLSGVTLTATNLDMLLVAPDGSHATLVSSDVPSAGVVTQTWSYDDEAAAPQENGLTGLFKPTNIDGGPGDSDALPDAPAEFDGQLLNFDGLTPNGTWKLYAANSGLVAPIGSITGWALEITTVTGITSPSPGSKDFGRVTVGQTSAPQAFEIKNTGDAVMTLTGAALQGPDASSFSIGSNTCTGAALAPTVVCSLDVVFKPVSAGAKTASLALTDNTGAAPQLLALLGTGEASSTGPITGGGSQQPSPPPSGTGSPDVTVSQAQFTGPTDVGRPTTLHVEASDDRDPVTGVLVDFGERLGLYGASGCVEGMKPGDASFDIPYTFLTPGQHTIKVTVFAGGCGKASAHTTTFSVTVGGEKAARRAAHSSETLAAPDITSKCRNARMLPSKKKAKLIIKAVLCVINEQRKLAKLKPLRLNKKLGKAAVAHTKAMVGQKFFAHQGPKEKNLAGRLKKAKYRGAAGENIGAGAGPLGSPVGMVNGWMHSTLHRANILEKKWRTVGIGFLAQFPVPTASSPVATFTTDFGSAKR